MGFSPRKCPRHGFLLRILIQFPAAQSHTNWNWQRGIRAFFLRKKAAKKAPGESAWLRSQTICACNLSIAKRASGQKKNLRQSEKMSLLIFPGLTQVFHCAHAHSLASFAGLPGSGELRHPSNCGKLLVIHVAQHPPAAGPGWGSHPGGVWGKAPSHPPRQIPVCIIYSFI